MFGKVMSIDDSLIIKYFTLATQVPPEQITGFEKELKNGANPRYIKKRLAEELVTLYYGSKKAAAASKEFDKIFSKKEKPTDLPEAEHAPGGIIDILVDTKLASSRSEARRLVEQKGVKVNDQVVGLESQAGPGDVIQVGKRKFLKLK
jgi:tyrosyl-tRNA synthetase